MKNTLAFGCNQCVVALITIWSNWITSSSSAVVPPPWADPLLNPCASQPRGWQLIQWPDNGKCYQIFQKGFPCPPDMELSPVVSSHLDSPQQLEATCRCPPKTLQYRDGKCYEIFTAGPCDTGEYFAPDLQRIIEYGNQWGTCLAQANCNNPNQLFWPPNNLCYDQLTRGPCPDGQLLTSNGHGLAICDCNPDTMMDYYYAQTHCCYAHFTKGPCSEEGLLFLPSKQCGCHKTLPHYYNTTQSCYELGTIGPCSIGEMFQLDTLHNRGVCECRKGNIRYTGNGHCYRPYTQGPCASGSMLINQTHCIRQPCERNHLYFPADQKCHRIGALGLCRQGEVVSFDLTTRPSVDGISYNGVCVCASKTTCMPHGQIINECRTATNSVMFRSQCYKLYTQGPCARGAWIVPNRHKRDHFPNNGYCDCIPSYTKIIRTVHKRILTECLPPSVLVANYVNKV